MTETPRQQIERILGGKVTPFNEQSLPGLVPIDGTEVVYFSNFGAADLYGQMEALTEQVAPPVVKHGGIVTTKHTLSLPDGQLFHALKCRGDLEGWRQQIAGGAKALGILLGRIENASTFVLSDGRTFALADCQHGRV